MHAQGITVFPCLRHRCTQLSSNLRACMAAAFSGLPVMWKQLEAWASMEQRRRMKQI